jgi:hypothetical protein
VERVYSDRLPTWELRRALRLSAVNQLREALQIKQAPVDSDIVFGDFSVLSEGPPNMKRVLPFTIQMGTTCTFKKNTPRKLTPRGSFRSLRNGSMKLQNRNLSSYLPYSMDVIDLSNYIENFVHRYNAEASIKGLAGLDLVCSTTAARNIFLYVYPY